jgi:hypothetical protein
MQQAKLHQHNGAWMTARQIAESCGVPLTIIYTRLTAGKTGTALTEPPASQAEKVRRARKALHGGKACTPKHISQRRS